MTAATDTVSAPRQGHGRHWAVATGAFIVMIGASILLSGLLIFTAPIISDLYYLKDAAGKVVLRTLASGARVPVEINGGQGAYLLYFSIMTFTIVIPLLFFAGQLLARFGARVMLVVGGVVMTIGLVIFARSTGSATFYLAAALLGLGYGLSMALIPPVLVNNWFVAKRGLVLGIVLAGTGVGGVIWAAIGPSLATSSVGWRGVLQIMAVSMAICTILPALFLIRNQPADVGLVPYGAAGTPVAGAAAVGAVPGFSYAQARRSSNFWIACLGFLALGMVLSVTQVLSIIFRTAAYPNPVDKTTWTPGQVAFYSSLFMAWLICVVFWKPVLGMINDKIGLAAMLLVSASAMALAVVYLPSMVYGTPVILMYVAMLLMSSGISSALVAPPLVIGQAMGAREFAKIFSLAVAFLYAGNAIGAPIWGLLGTSGNTKVGLYLAPILLALFVLASLVAARRGQAQYRRLAQDETRAQVTRREATTA
jgi:OFA family oxalate/formate antiporter-like MFS transporter